MISLSTYNVKNFKSNHKMVKNLLKTNKINFLVEHWLSKEEKHLLENFDSNFNVLFESEFSDLEERRGRPFGGTAWMVHKSIKVLNYKYYDRHLSSIEFELLNGSRMVVLGVWIPFDDGNTDTWCHILSVFSHIESIRENLPLTTKLVILGDWNSDPRRESLKRIDKRLIEFERCNEMVMCEYEFEQEVDHTYFNVRENGRVEAHIDHILVDMELFRYVKSCKIINNVLNLSDHLPLVIEFDKELPSCRTETNENKNFHFFSGKAFNFKTSTLST